MASIDGEGQIICREIENPDSLLCQFSPMNDYDGLCQPESAHVLFNTLDQSIMFVAINNVLLTYRTQDLQSGFELVCHHAFKSNILKIEQQRKLLVLMCDDNSLVVYQWEERRVVEEMAAGEELSAMTSSETSVLVGTSGGVLLVWSEN